MGCHHLLLGNAIATGASIKHNIADPGGCSVGRFRNPPSHAALLASSYDVNVERGRGDPPCPCRRPRILGWPARESG